MWSDPIADLLTRIRNGYTSLKSEVRVPFSKMKEAILVVLKKNEFIQDYKVEGAKAKKTLVVVLRYEVDKEPALEKIRRVSKPGLRVYQKAKEHRKVLSGLGIGIISTSEGIMTLAEAREKNLGGEVLAEVW